MIKQVIEFQEVGYGSPSDEELEECIKVQKENPDKLVRLHYTVKWSGKYTILFMNDDGSIRETVAEVREHMPKYYGM